MNNNNATSAPCGNFEHTGDFGKYSLIIMYVIVITIAFFGNTLMLLVVVWNKQMQTFTNLLLCNCAVSDLLMIFPAVWDVVDILKYDGRWVLGQFMCSFLFISIYLTVGVSIISLMVISIDRYFAAILPYHKKQSNHILWFIIPGIWLVAFIISSPAVFIQKVVHIPDYGNVCIESWPTPFDPIKSPKYYTVTLFVIYYLIPLIMMSFIYITIGRKLLRDHHKIKKKSEKIQQRENQNKREEGEAETGKCCSAGGEENKKKLIATTNKKNTFKRSLRGSAKQNRFERNHVIKLIVLLVVTFAVCWLPVFILQFFTFFYPKFIRCIQLVPEWAYAVVYLVQYASSAINPILYFSYSTVYRKGVSVCIRRLSRSEELNSSIHSSQRKMTLEANIE